MSEAKTILLKTNDDKTHVFPLQCAKMSITLSSLIEDFGTIDLPIPVGDISSYTLEKVLEYCQHCIEIETMENEDREVYKKQWTDEFCKVEIPQLFLMITAANYLDIKGMLDITCDCVAKMMIGKTPEEIRQHFGIKNDFTEEEEKQMYNEIEWIDDL